MAKFLVVDDAAFMRMMVRDILTRGGHSIVGEASNGQEAVEQYQALKPDVVTLDITMPVKDGLQALGEIMKLDPSAKVIMCSAMGQQAMVFDAIRGGAKDFVVKPFQAERVLESVAKIIG